MPTPPVLQSLASNLIDYAGTFPPASLSLDQSLAKAATFRRSARLPFLMGKVALPLTDLLRIKTSMLWDVGADGSPWTFAALGSPVQSTPEWARTVEWDCREIRRFNEKFSRASVPQRITALEMKAPPDMLSEPRAIEVLNQVLERVATLVSGDFELFIELDFASPAAAALADRIAVESSAFLESGKTLRLGLKLRYAGDPLPTPAVVAQALALCATHGLQFKATQGLHEAFTAKKKLGFLNLFAALNFVFVHGTGEFPVSQLVELLGDEEVSNFQFSDTALTWRSFILDAEAIETARRRHGGCFGSCSLDEPEESLLRHFA